MTRNKTIYLILAAGFLFLTNLVYLNYGLHATPDHRYTGANPHAAADKLVYMSMIQQGREGFLFMKNLHTTEPQKGLLFSPHWYLIGQTGKIFNISNNAAYQIYRLVFILLFLWMLYVFLSKLFRSKKLINLAALFVLYTGGLGWYVFLKYPQILTSDRGQFKYLNSPTDLYVTEGTTLLNFTQAPLFSLSQLMLVLIFYLFIKYRDDRRVIVDVVNAALIALLIMIHPYDLPIIFAVLGSWSVWYLYKTKEWLIAKKLLILGVGGCIGAAYNLFLIGAEPVLLEWLKQNLVYSPPIRQYIIGYALLIPFWIIGVVAALRNKKNNPWWIMILIWSSVIWILIYLPLDINRRFVNGWHIALAIVATYGFYYLYQHIRMLWLKITFTAVSMFFLLSAIGFFLFISVLFSPGAYSYGYYYVTKDEDSIITFIEETTTRDEKLLVSDMKTAFTVTANVNRAAFRVHDHQTPQVHLKQQQLEWFFADQDTEASIARKKQFLHDEDIDLVVVNWLRLDRPTRWIHNVDFVEEVLQSGNLTVYRVVR